MEELTQERMSALLDAFEESSWAEMVVTVGNDRLHVSRDRLTELSATAPGRTVPTPQPAVSVEPATAEPVPQQAAPAAPLPEAGTAIESPSVGLFWRAPSPGAPPFVEVGQRIGVGDPVGIVEVMKLMNQVSTSVDGVVTAILVENGGAVEFGQPLVIVDPEG
jgi:acetyl-CoA carboxylase biotin carboxyl carrier protein